jgi:hypothetical protein
VGEEMHPVQMQGQRKKKLYLLDLKPLPHQIS